MTAETKDRAYHSISEVSAMAGVEPHVLRYWETQFKMLRPKKNRAGNRMYRPKDIGLVMTIKKLLYEQGFTISGARRKLLDTRRQSSRTSAGSLPTEGTAKLLKSVKKELEDILSLVRKTS
ncbi:MAG: MerR family transcriptional regulator [Candidatus Eiseniibacteriota bacterium]|nr:MAG: MerR family transcriptional regulator [Candidatus Eisenbacteria bacterium]